MWAICMLTKVKNPDAKGIYKRGVRRFCSSNNIRRQSNLSKEEFQKIIFFSGIKGMTFKVFVIQGNNRFLEKFWKGSPKLLCFLDYITIIIKIYII